MDRDIRQRLSILEARLQQLGMDLNESLGNIDRSPAATCVQVGVAVEHLLRQLWKQLGLKGSPDEKRFEDLLNLTIKKLEENGNAMPRSVVTAIREIQLRRNDAAHYWGTVKRVSAINALGNLADVTHWYFADYLRSEEEGSVQAIDSQPLERLTADPEPPGNSADTSEAFASDRACSVKGRVRAATRRWVNFWLAVGAMLVLCWFAVLLSKYFPRNPLSPPNRLEHNPVAYKGSVDLLVHRKDTDGTDLALPLSDVRVWPLKPGDSVKVTAEIDPPAYVYLFWIDESGTTFPIYPWTPLKWDTRPAQEQKVGSLEVKDPNGNWFKISGPTAGMETLQMLAGPEPLEATEAEMKDWFRNLQPLPFAGERVRVWFEGFDLVRHDPNRSPEYGDTMGPEFGPLGLQALLHRRIGTQAGFSRAVSFSRVGKEK